MNDGNLVTYEQLVEATGFEENQPGCVCTQLEKQNIKYFRGKGGKPWTTIGLIEAAAGLNPANQNQPQSNDIL